jgi:hypothetical protein
MTQAAERKPEVCHKCELIIAFKQNFIVITSVEYHESDGHKHEFGTLQGRIYFHTECFMEIAGDQYIPEIGSFSGLPHKHDLNSSDPVACRH